MRKQIKRSPYCDYVVSSHIYRNLYIFAYILLTVFFVTFLIIGIIIDEKSLSVISSIFILFLAFGFYFNAPILSKFYIEEQKVIVKFGVIYKRELTFKESKSRITELVTRDQYKTVILKEKYIVMTRREIDLDSILYYADNELLKVMRKKNVIVIPEAKIIMLWKTGDGSPAAFKYTYYKPI